MAAHLTDRKKKKIIADYIELGSYNAVAKMNGVSATTVKNIVLKNVDIIAKFEEKKEENTIDILNYMESKKDIVCEILGKGLEALNSPDKLAKATPAQITTALGTLIDKWALKGKTGSDSALTEDDPITKALKEEAGNAIF